MPPRLENGLPSLTETAFASQVESLLYIYSWRWVHQRPAITTKGWRTTISGHAGFLDYFAARIHNGKRQMLLFELKSEDGEATPDQQLWLDVTGGFLWKPSDFEDIKIILSDGE
jgi:hypothetical protein